jgi:hypothetical protein
MVYKTFNSLLDSAVLYLPAPHSTPHACLRLMAKPIKRFGLRLPAAADEWEQRARSKPEKPRTGQSGLR